MQALFAVAIVSGALWLRAMATDYCHDRPVWIIANVICWPCGVVRGGVMWYNQQPMRPRQSLSKAVSAPITPDRVRIAPITA